MVAAPKSQLATIKASAITSGDQVKAQITNTVSQFDGQTGNIKQMLVGQVDNIKNTYQEPARTYDGYRYAGGQCVCLRVAAQAHNQGGARCLPGGPSHARDQLHALPARGAYNG